MIIISLKDRDFELALTAPSAGFKGFRGTEKAHAAVHSFLGP